MEAEFRRIEGVVATTVGYAGGTSRNPSYHDVCSGRTGHAEVVQVEYDPAQVSYEALLKVFWENHNPTASHYDPTDQYRAVIFFHTPEQEVAALAYKQRQEDEKRYKKPITTQIVPAGPFYRAEEYHQQYYEKRGFSICKVRLG